MIQKRPTLWSELKAARKAVGHTQESLATEIGADRGTVARLEQGAGSFANVLLILDKVHHRHVELALGSNLADQLRNRRQKLKIDQASAALAAGLNRKTIAALERGQGSLRSADAYLRAIAPKAALKRVDDSLWSYNRGKAKKTDSRFTPKDFVEKLIAAFGPISLDPCSHDLSPVPALKRVILPEDGLLIDWSQYHHVYVNPPFSNFERWLKKANDTWEGGMDGKITVLMPTARIDIGEFMRRTSCKATTLHLAHRLNFTDPENLMRGGRAPFSVSIVCFGCSNSEIESFRADVPSLRLDPQDPNI